MNGNVAVRATIYQAHELLLWAARGHCQNKGRAYSRGLQGNHSSCGGQEGVWCSLPVGALTGLWRVEAKNVIKV